jgi:predicted PhzF superfamily epimerase YddE/YHI9
LNPDLDRLRDGCDRLGLLGCLAARLAHRNVTQITVDMGDSLDSPATITATTKQTSAGIRIDVGGYASVAQARRIMSSDLA